jgi:hypothetical protein
MVLFEINCAELSVALGSEFSLSYILNIETGNPPEGWESAGQYRTTNFEQQKFLKNKTVFFTSTFCGFLFCVSAVRILDDVIADS